MSRTISIIMPAFNEGACIYDNISTTAGVLREAGLSCEIVVVDDGSGDNTLDEIERAAADIPRVVGTRNPYNMGKGMALRTGFDHSSGDIIIFLDADLDLHPAQITSLLEELDRGPYDVIVTSKHHPDSNIQYPAQRKIVSWGYYQFIKALFSLPVRDTQTGLKLFRREVLDSVFHRLLVKAYAYDVELLAVAIRFGYRVHEMPVVLDFKRAVTWGRIRLSDVVRIFTDTLAVFYRLRILRYYDDERPPWPKDHTPVLVLIRGAPPEQHILQRLQVDTNTTVSCILDPGVTEEYKVEGIGMCFRNEDEVKGWLAREGTGIGIIGFLGSGCIPVGSWVKNALRNFKDDDSVTAVCGPVVASPGKGLLRRVASMLSTTMLTAGPNAYLHAIKRFRPARRGSMDNIFLRTEALDRDGSFPLYRRGSLVLDPVPARRSMKYDPDVAVSKPAPPLFIPYMRRVTRDAFSNGLAVFDHYGKISRFWPFLQCMFTIVMLAGWVILPPLVYKGLIGVSAALALTSVGLYFDPSAVPVFLVGLGLEYIVRAVTYPAGVITRIFRGYTPRS